jgi:hypothetical protein
VLRVGVPVELSTVERYLSILLAVSFAIKQRSQKRSKVCMVLGVTPERKAKLQMGCSTKGSTWVSALTCRTALSPRSALAHPHLPGLLSDSPCENGDRPGPVHSFLAHPKAYSSVAGE